MADRRTVAEGAFTAPVLAALARDRGIDMPIVSAVEKLLSGAAVASVLEDLLAAAAADGRHLEIDRDALLLPVAIAGGVEPLLLAVGRRARRRAAPAPGPAATWTGSAAGRDGLGVSPPQDEHGGRRCQALKAFRRARRR